MRAKAVARRVGEYNDTIDKVSRRTAEAPPSDSSMS